MIINKLFIHYAFHCVFGQNIDKLTYMYHKHMVDKKTHMKISSFQCEISF
jgi:hypothetical protein